MLLTKYRPCPIVTDQKFLFSLDVGHATWKDFFALLAQTSYSLCVLTMVYSQLNVFLPCNSVQHGQREGGGGRGGRSAVPAHGGNEEGREREEGNGKLRRLLGIPLKG